MRRRIIAVIVGSFVLTASALPAAAAATSTTTVRTPTVVDATASAVQGAKAVSAGWRHTCAIKHDDRLACWGFANGTILDAPPGTFSAVSAGSYHTCAIKTNGELDCWGDDSSGQSTPPPGTFVAVSTVGVHTCAIATNGTLSCWGGSLGTTPTGTFDVLSTGNSHACAIRTNGAIDCWGSNDFGEATEPPGTWSAIASGSQYSCGIKTNGTLDCWGRDDGGRLDSPAGTYTAVSADWSHACAVRSDGVPMCWGDPYNGTTTPPSGDFASVSAGGYHTCGIRTSGWLACWGGFDDGEATPPLGLRPVVTAGWLHSCALRPDASVTCWGLGDDGETTVPGGTYKTVTAGGGFTCAIKTNDSLDCWGYGDDGQTAAPPGTFTSVSAGANHACAVQTSGTIDCWGLNDFGQSDPPPGLFRAVSAGYRNTCALGALDGSLSCWGSDEDGVASPDPAIAAQVAVGGFHACLTQAHDQGVRCWGYTGDGATQSPTGPFTEIGAGNYHSCGLRADSTLACWGFDGDDQASPPAGDFIAVSAGGWHSCAIEVDGAPVCWGWNYYNQSSPGQSAPTTYVPVTPTRLLDSRTGNGLTGRFKANIARSFQVAGRGPVPADAVAVTGNFTVTGQTAPGYGSLTPVATNTPTTSTLNFPVGDSRANNVTLALGPTGAVGAVYKARAGTTTDFLFDVTGYFLADDTAATYEPTVPVRLLDTRAANGLNGTFASGTPRAWQIAGRGGIPADATAITGNLTVVGQTSGGYVSLGPVSTTSPTTSTVNFPSGDTRANGLTVKLGVDGKLSAVFKGIAGARTHLILDVTGYYVDDLGGARFYPLDPDRLLDSRYEIGLDRFRANIAQSLTVAGRVGVPDDAVAVTGNLTVVGQTKGGFVSMTQALTNSPTTSTINFPVADVRANGVTGPLTTSGAGRVGLVYRAQAGATTHLLLDVSGYFGSAIETSADRSPLPDNPPAPNGMDDTRRLEAGGRVW